MKKLWLVSESRMFLFVWKVVDQNGEVLIERASALECIDWLWEKGYKRTPQFGQWAYGKPLFQVEIIDFE